MTVTGTVEAREVDLASQVTGQIVSLAADEGDLVRPGLVLAVIDGEEIRLKVAGLEARLAEAEATLADLRSLPRKEDLEWQRSKVVEAEVILERAREDLDRAKRLEGQGVSRQEVDQLASARRLAEQRLETARRELATVEAGARLAQIDAAASRAAEIARDLDLARLELARTRVTAPVDGTILSRNYEVGELVAPGDPLFTIVDLSHLRVELAVDERLHGRIIVGQPAEIRAEAQPGRSIMGRVSFVAARYQFTPRNVQTRDERSKLTFRVKVAVEDPPPFLKPGMFVDVTFAPGVCATR